MTHRYVLKKHQDFVQDGVVDITYRSISDNSGFATPAGPYSCLYCVL